jgi:hypothetical protein
VSPLRALAFLGAILVTATTGEAAGPSASDVVTLTDGKTVSGEVRESSARALVMVVRRDWARQNVPNSAKRWEAAEKTTAPRALSQRRERLNAWRRDRTLPPVVPPAIDRITPWINRELAKLKPGSASEPTPLMLVRLSHGEFTKVSRRPKGSDGLLRQAWLSGFRDPESMPLEELKDALEARGFDVSRPLNPSIDTLLPPQHESDAAWTSRRAATEVLYDPNLKFLRYQGILMVEPGNGGGNPAMTAIQALPALGALLGQAQDDQLPVRLRMLAAWGRAGAMVTRLEIAPDLSAVSVEITLYVRQGSDRWQPAGTRVSRVRPEDLGPEAGKELADDPQVGMAFKLIEAAGLKELSPEIKKRSLAIGAATRTALGKARAQAESDLGSLAFPVLEVPAAEGKPGQAP